MINLIQGDNIESLRTLEDNSLDSVVTDPPYGLSFMNKKWDHSVPSVEFWQECLRVLKPGGHVLSFGGTRTYHRMAVAIEDAGFEIRDQIQWLYGSGFPKSHNIKKALDKKGEPSEKWDGYGTALKPANEPIVLARKPLSEKTIVDNVLKWGVGCINIDDCRVELKNGEVTHGSGASQSKNSNTDYGDMKNKRVGVPNITSTQGRFPANVILDEHAKDQEWSRYFYCPKASKKERNAGLENIDLKQKYSLDKSKSQSHDCFTKGDKNPCIPQANNHPTVKPIKLMEYLIKLVTPKGGTVLDPFMGSGTTGVAAKNLGFDFVGMELSEEYFEIATKRIEGE